MFARHSLVALAAGLLQATTAFATNPFAAAWKLIRGTTKIVPAGVHDIVVVQSGADPVDVDWLRFR